MDTLYYSFVFVRTHYTLYSIQYKRYTNSIHTCTCKIKPIVISISVCIFDVRTDRQNLLKSESIYKINIALIQSRKFILGNVVYILEVVRRKLNSINVHVSSLDVVHVRFTSFSKSLGMVT